jgi:hypothetical protein
MATIVDRVEAAATPARRRYLYRLTGAVVLILGVHGVAEADTLQAYLQAVAIFLGVAPAELAARHTPRG